MYRKYSATSDLGGAVMAATAKTAVAVLSAATVRGYIYDWTFGTIGTPSDSVVTLTVVRESGTLTQSTAVTPQPLDSVDSAATSTSRGAYTTEPTIGVVLFSVGLNVRATYRWVAAPGGELVMPASAAADAIGMRALSPAYVLDAQGTVYFAE